MKSTYVNTKKELDRIRNKYGCKGDVLFRTAIQYVVEHGQMKFNRKSWVNNQLHAIEVKHNIAESEGKILFVGREFEKALIECAAEIANVNTYDLLIYIQKEVFLSNEGGLDYQRAIELLHSCMNWFVDYDCCETKEMLKRFEDLDFADNELETLGFTWLFDTEEDN